jgi:hypothetical protein
LKNETWSWYYEDSVECFPEHATRESAVKEAMARTSPGRRCHIRVGRIVELDPADLVRATDILDLVLRRLDDIGFIVPTIGLSIGSDEALAAWLRKYLFLSNGKSCHGHPLEDEELQGVSGGDAEDGP